MHVISRIIYNDVEEIIPKSLYSLWQALIVVILPLAISFPIILFGFILAILRKKFSFAIYYIGVVVSLSSFIILSLNPLILNKDMINRNPVSKDHSKPFRGETAIYGKNSISFDYPHSWQLKHAKPFNPLSPGLIQPFDHEVSINDSFLPSKKVTINQRWLRDTSRYISSLGIDIRNQYEEEMYKKDVSIKYGNVDRLFKQFQGFPVVVSQYKQIQHNKVIARGLVLVFRRSIKAEIMNYYWDQLLNDDGS